MAENGMRPSYEKVDQKVEVMDTPYDRWITSQGIDVIRGFCVADLYTVPLKWWDRMGGNGVYIMLDGTGYQDVSHRKPSIANAIFTKRSTMFLTAAARRRFGSPTDRSKASSGRPAVCSPFRSMLCTSTSMGKEIERRGFWP